MSRLSIPLAILTTVPAMCLRAGGMHLTPGLEAVLFGIAIFGAACVLTWASEVAQLDISQGLAIAFLALVAVLPEYAVDLYFAWQAPHHPDYTAYATANMTGANRLLIGVAWPLIVVLYWWTTRKSELELPCERSVELAYLALATAYSFIIPIKGTISLLDTVVLVGLFVAYMWRISGAEAEEPELFGPTAWIGSFAPRRRRQTVAAMFVFAGGVILASAEPFAEALIHTGKTLGMDEFLLVQWLAPLASEAPEVVIACMLTLRANAQAGMGAMISAKVNQWTLLVGTLPLVYSVSLGAPGALHLDTRQVGEIWLTAAQSAFAVAVLANLRLSLTEAAALFFLFIGQFLFPSESARGLFAIIYVALGGVMIVRRRRIWAGLFMNGLIKSAELGPTDAPCGDAGNHREGSAES